MDGIAGEIAAVRAENAALDAQILANWRTLAEGLRRDGWPERAIRPRLHRLGLEIAKRTSKPLLAWALDRARIDRALGHAPGDPPEPDWPAIIPTALADIVPDRP